MPVRRVFDELAQASEASGLCCRWHSPRQVRHESRPTVQTEWAPTSTAQHRLHGRRQLWRCVSNRKLSRAAAGCPHHSKSRQQRFQRPLRCSGHIGTSLVTASHRERSGPWPRLALGSDGITRPEQHMRCLTAVRAFVPERRGLSPTPTPTPTARAASSISRSSAGGGVTILDAGTGLSVSRSSCLWLQAGGHLPDTRSPHSSETTGDRLSPLRLIPSRLIPSRLIPCHSSMPFPTRMARPYSVEDVPPLQP